MLVIASRLWKLDLENGLKIVTIYIVSIIDSDIVMLQVSVYKIAEIQIFEKLATKTEKIAAKTKFFQIFEFWCQKCSKLHLFISILIFGVKIQK